MTERCRAVVHLLHHFHRSTSTFCEMISADSYIIEPNTFNATTDAFETRLRAGWESVISTPGHWHCY